MTMISDGPRASRWFATASARVARLTAERGLTAGHLGVVRRQDEAFVALLLGCLRSGAKFTVLDPDSPVDPKFLGVSTVLDPAELLGDAPEESDVDEEAPDGGWAAERLRADDRVAILSGVTGQLASGVAGAVSAGAALHVGVPPLTEPLALVEWLRVNEITVVFSTTPVLRALCAQDGNLGALRQVIVENTGDLLVHDVEALWRIAPSCTLLSTYRTDHRGRPLTVHEMPPGSETDDAPLLVPLGSLPSDRDARLVTSSGSATAVGEVGELHLDSHATGDLLRAWPGGTLEFADAGETLAALRELPDVRDAVLAERFDADGEPVLVAYVTGPSTPAAALRQALALRVAAEDVPARLVVVDSIPLTATGGYDTDELPDPEFDDDGAEHVEPRTPLEETLTGILRELLKRDRIGVLDSFFDLGGFSLLATQLATRIRESFGVELSLREIFEAPTVEGLAQLIVRREVELSGAGELEALLDEIERSDTGS